MLYALAFGVLPLIVAFRLREYWVLRRPMARA